MLDTADKELQDKINTYVDGANKNIGQDTKEAHFHFVESFIEEISGKNYNFNFNCTPMEAPRLYTNNNKYEFIYIMLDGRFTNDKDGKQKEFP